jgi:hypothetical protein
MKKSKKVKMTFEVIVDLDILIDEDALKFEFDNDIHKLCKMMYREEGIWWDNKFRLIKSKILDK